MKRSSYFKDVVGRFKTHKLAMAGMCILILEILLLLILPVIMDLKPYEIYSGFGAFPSKEHILDRKSVV